MGNKYIEANSVLDSIEELGDNWNENGAVAFSPTLIQRCRKILVQLISKAFVCPTARDSIQFEYEKANEDNLEFEIFQDYIEVYSDTIKNGKEEYTLSGIMAIEKMKQLVVEFGVKKKRFFK